MSLLEQLLRLVADRYESSTMMVERLLKAQMAVENGRIYEMSLSDQEYNDMIDFLRGLGEHAITQLVFLLRDDERRLRQHLPVKETPPSTPLPSNPSTPSPTVSKSMPLSLTNDDEISYGDDENKSEFAVDDSAFLVYPTKALFDMIQPDMKRMNGDTLKEKDCEFAKTHLLRYAEQRIPLSSIPQQIFDDHYEKYPKRAIQLCQLFCAGLERVDRDNVQEILDPNLPTTETLKIVQCCIKELDDIYQANRAARSLSAPDRLPSIEIFESWERLYHKVRDIQGKMVKSLKEHSSSIDDSSLRKGARLGLHILEGDGPRRTEYKSLMFVEENTNDKSNNGGNDEEKGNTYSNGHVILRDYVLQKRYGNRDFRVTENTQLILDELVHRNAGVYLLTGSSEPVSEEKWKELFTQDISGLINKDLSFRHIRFAYIHYLQQSGKLTSVHSQARLAITLGLALPEVIANMRVTLPSTKKRSSSNNEGTHKKRRKSGRRHERHLSATGSQETLSERGYRDDPDSVSMESGEIDDDSVARQ